MAAGSEAAVARQMPVIAAEDFGVLEGRTVRLWRLSRETEAGRIAIAVSEYGAALTSCTLPDASGRETDIVLGYDTLAQYVAGEAYCGAICGRYGNRLRDSWIEIDGQGFALVPNEGRNQLHGGPSGFHRLVWSGGASPDGEGLLFRLTSPDGDMGYPGRLDVEVTFRIEARCGLRIEMSARCDRPTICNLVHHAYWNLGGHDRGDPASWTVLDHVAHIAADFYTPVDGEQLATGEIRRVEGTPLDFRVAKRIGQDIASGKLPGGYDHNLVLGPASADGLRDCAEIACEASGIVMSLRTSEPGVQFYTGNLLGPGDIGKGGQPFAPHAGFALESQKFPCSPQFGHFLSALLRPGEEYRHVMSFGFRRQ
jgi:aldose 1-epimerase